MTLLNPWALWLASLIPLIVLLYLLKVRRQPLTVSTLIFWQRVVDESQRRALFHRLRNFFSLLLHLLIFALILAALARPALDSLVREGASTIVVLDVRARMQAIEADGRTRFEKARDLAAAHLRQAGASRHLALLTVGTTPAVAAAFSDDEKVLREALDRVTVSDSGGDLAPALALADSLLASRTGDRRIVLITDRKLSETEFRIQNSEFESISTATPRENVAITRFASRPLLNSPQTCELLLVLRNFGRSEARGQVELSLDDRRLDVKSLTLAPGEERIEVFSSVPRSARARGFLTAKLDSADALPLDNTARAVLPAQSPVRVLLVSKGNWFLEKLLAADPSIAHEQLAPDAATPEIEAKFDVIIHDDALPAGFDLASQKGSRLFIKTTPFASAGPPVEQPVITDLESAHPALRLVNLQNIAIVRASALATPQPADGWRWQMPLRSFDRPLFITGERGPQRLAALAFDPGESDLPLRIAFPLLISNTLHWLAGAPSTAPAEAPPGLPNGFHEIATPDGPRWIAVNTFDDAESDTAAAAPTTVTAPIARALPTLFGWPLWRYLALAALALTAAEWRLFHRRKTE